MPCIVFLYNYFLLNRIQLKYWYGLYDWCVCVCFSELDGVIVAFIMTVDGKWQPWSLWSGCSKTCGGGSQQRNRICYGPFFEGQVCPGEQEEVRLCNEKRCPGECMGKSACFICKMTSFPPGSTVFLCKS